MTLLHYFFGSNTALILTRFQVLGEECQNFKRKIAKLSIFKYLFRSRIIKDRNALWPCSLQFKVFFLKLYAYNISFRLYEVLILSLKPFKKGMKPNMQEKFPWNISRSNIWYMHGIIILMNLQANLYWIFLQHFIWFKLFSHCYLIIVLVPKKLLTL